MYKRQVHYRTFLDLAKVRVIVRIRDDSDLETVLLGVAYRQADAVHANGAFLHGRCV